MSSCPVQRPLQGGPISSFEPCKLCKLPFDPLTAMTMMAMMVMMMRMMSLMVMMSKDEEDVDVSHPLTSSTTLTTRLTWALLQ